MRRTILLPLALVAAMIGLVIGLPSDGFSSQEPTFMQPSQLHQPQLQSSSSSSQQSTFDIASYRNIYEAIQSHPELREFASLCQMEGVKEIVSMAMTPLTVFAPVDAALAELLGKAKSRSIGLIELARHHIAQEQVTLELNTRYPIKKLTYANLSPLYLSQQTLVQAGRPKQPATFVNNARILSTHLLPIDGDAYQTLHIIDQPLDFAHSNRRAQLRGPPAKWTTVRRPLSLDELLGAAGPETQQLALAGLADYQERFSDVRAHQDQADLLHTRLPRARPELNLNRLGVALRALSPPPAQLRGRLFDLNESLTLNTYFLPVSSDELDAVLAGEQLPRLLEAHILPDQVLFTRPMQLGVAHQALYSRRSGQKVSLSLAKTLPADESSPDYLATPLLLQARCSAPSQPEEPAECRPGVTSAEILLANVPVTSGVLHLIKRPVLATGQVNVLDYLNDHDNQLSQLVNSLGSQTSVLGACQNDLQSNKVRQEELPQVNRFRELLAKERQLLSQFSQDPHMNKTILAPSDQAFGRLRFELRALVQGDESLVPKHWDASYRQDLIERLVRRHVVAHQTIASDQVQAAGGQLIEALSDSGKLLRFSATTGQSECPQQVNVQVESDGSQAHLLQRDLIGTNGVLHIIDSVLGEDLETVHSLLRSLVLRFNHTQQQTEETTTLDQLVQLVQASLKAAGSQPEQVDQNIHSISSTQEAAGQAPASRQSPELSLVAKSIGRYLDELAGSSQGQRQLQQVAASVNMSYQLARLSSLAEGQEDWNEMFKQPERSFTYFVPSDLAWFKLLQTHPELYQPLLATLGGIQGPPLDSAAGGRPRYSESSHRLRQILERHLVVNRRLTKEELNGLDSLQTLGANLRLIETQPHQQTAPPEQVSAFASLQSLVGVGQSSSQQTQQNQANKQIKRSLRLRGDSSGQQAANIVQAHDASNGFVYILDSVLITPEDPYYLLQTGSSPSASSSILGGQGSYLGDLLHSILSPTPFNLSASSMLALISTLTLAISILLVLALVLLVRRQRQNKLNRHQQLESGLTSSSSANSGSTSTTKSL